MELISVESSNISNIGWEPKLKTGTLRIIFKNKLVYDYLFVPESVFKNFIASESKGSYFHRFIKPTYIAKRIVEV